MRWSAMHCELGLEPVPLAGCDVREAMWGGDMRRRYEGGDVRDALRAGAASWRRESG